MSEPLANVSPWIRLRIQFARHRKNINENLGLIIALLAAAFAGWSGWEAQKAREEAVLSSKIAQRSYVEAEDDSVAGGMLLNQPFLDAHYTLKVYGNSPAFGIVVTSNCKLGPAGLVLNKPGGITKDDLKTDSLRLPGIMVVGSQTPLQSHCQPTASSDESIGMVEYGEIDYKDVFGDSHYTHFCYYNPTLIHAAVASRGDKKSQWNEQAMAAGQHLIPCGIYNDAN